MLSKDAEIILQKANEIPPISWLPNNPTDDQREHWQLIHQIYSCLRVELHSYFSGDESPLRELLPPIWVDTVKPQAYIYINLYNLLREGWDVIKSGVERLSRNLNLDSNHSRTVDLISSASSPGQLLASIIEMDCKHQFEQCLSYSEFKPRKALELISTSEKVEKLENINSELSKSEVRKVAEYNKTIERMAKPLRRKASPIVTGLCICLCSEYLKRNKRNELKNALRQYQKSQAERNGFAKAQLHPRKKIKGSKWENGFCLPLT